MAINRLLIIFTHIPKCAGTSLRESLIKNNINNSLIYRPEKGIRGIIGYKQDFAYMVGHWPYGTENLISPFNPARHRKKIYITILREPLDHMISFFYFQKQLGRKSLFKKKIDEYDIVSFYQNNPAACNLQTKFTAGLFLERFCRYTIFQRGSYLQLLSAKKNLIHNYPYVCQFEKLDIDLKNIALDLNLDFCSVYDQTTKTRNRPASDKIDQDIIDQLMQYNRLDFQLYKYAQNNIWK